MAKIITQDINITCLKVVFDRTSSLEENPEDIIHEGLLEEVEDAIDELFRDTGILVEVNLGTPGKATIVKD